MVLNPVSPLSFSMFHEHLCGFIFVCVLCKMQVIVLGASLYITEIVQCSKSHSYFFFTWHNISKWQLFLISLLPYPLPESLWLSHFMPNQGTVQWKRSVLWKRPPLFFQCQAPSSGIPWNFHSSVIIMMFHFAIEKYVICVELLHKRDCQKYIYAILAP